MVKGNYPLTNPEEESVMNFGESISVCMSKYATFTGRASRPEFW